MRKVRNLADIKNDRPSPPKWKAYGDLFAAVQTAKNWSRAQLVDALNADAKAKALPRCTYSKRTTEYWEADSTKGRSSTPRDHRASHLHAWLKEQVADHKYTERLAVIAPSGVNTESSEAQFKLMVRHGPPSNPAQRQCIKKWCEDFAKNDWRKVVKNTSAVKGKWDAGDRDALKHFLNNAWKKPEQPCENGLAPHQNLSVLLREYNRVAMDIEDGSLHPDDALRELGPDFVWWSDFLGDFVRTYQQQPEHLKPKPDPAWLTSIPKLIEFFPKPSSSQNLSSVADAPSSSLLPPRNPEFFGCETKLTEITKHFAKGGRVELTHSTAIMGDPGVGKTHLTLEFAHRCLADGSRKTVLWCRAESAGNFDEDLAAHAEMLGAPETLEGKKERMQFTLDWLRSSGDWLLVADNADEVAARNHVCERLKGRAQGWLLVTTKLRDPGEAFAKVEVEKLALKDSAEFLIQSVPGKGNDAEARKLATELDCLFLALAWAVAELRESGDTFAELLKRYRSAPLDVIRRLPQGWGDRKPVLKCWLISYERLSPLARRLLHVMGWFAAERIGEEWLTNSEWFSGTPAAVGLKPVPTNEQLSDALRELHARRFCVREGGFVSMHRLVQLSARTELLASLPKQSKLGAKVFLASAIDLLLRNSPPTGENSWDFMEWIEAYPHAEMLAAHIKIEHLRSAQAARLCFALAQSQRRLKRLRDSLVSYERAVGMAAEFLAKDSDAHEVARWHNAAACACCQLSAYPAAREYMTNVRVFTNRALRCTKDKIQRLIMERRFVCHDACTSLHWSYELKSQQHKQQWDKLQKGGLASREKQLEFSKQLRALRSKGEATSYLQALAEAGHAFQMARNARRAKALSKEGFAEFRRLRDSVGEWQHLESGISGFVNSTKHLAGLLFRVRMLNEAEEAIRFVLLKVPALGGCRNTDTHAAQLLLLQIKHAKKPKRPNIAAAKECVEALRARLEPNDRSLKQADEAIAGMEDELKPNRPKRRRSSQLNLAGEDVGVGAAAAGVSPSKQRRG